MRRSPADRVGLASALARLPDLQQLSLTDLRTEWRRLFRTQPPALSRDLLMRAIAYRMQELVYGGLPKATKRKLETLATAFRTDGTIRIDAGPRIKPGARLVREWRGRTHTVTVTESGFEYAGNAYPSLTKIARAITGAHWSGPRFFGLVQHSAVPPCGRPSVPAVTDLAPMTDAGIQCLPERSRALAEARHD